MADERTPWLGCAALRELAQQAAMAAPCSACAALQRPGWESVPGDFAREGLTRIGTLCRTDGDDPTLQEHHPAGTHFWSPDAPIAPAFHPANRSEVWRCNDCGRAFLRYTEYGGYYQDERVRWLDPALIDCSGCD